MNPIANIMLGFVIAGFLWEIITMQFRWMHATEIAFFQISALGYIWFRGFHL